MSTTMPCDRVGVVILNWFTEEETIRCAQSLPGAGEGVAAIYVVDNGSDAEGREKLRKELPEAVILGEGRNTGFAAGAYIGVRRALDDGCERTVDTRPEGVANVEVFAAYRKLHWGYASLGSIRFEARRSCGARLIGRAV